MSRVQTLNGVHVSCHHTSARDFECSGPPSLSQTGENVENIHQIMSLAHISLMELLVVLHVLNVELMLYQSPAAMGLCNRCHISKTVLQRISP